MDKKYTCHIIIFLIIVSCAAFGRITSNDFINYDDNLYITENYQIQHGINPQNIKWSFSAVVASNWHPITLLSHMLDWSLFGANASGHHLVSLFLHIGAVIFLFLLLNKTTNNIWSSAFATAFFALHPLRVESVAWMAERKDVLSMFFGTAALYAYAYYAESSKLSRYFLCLILFALSLMSKPMLVTLPFVLLLLDYWPLGRWQKTLSYPDESRPYSAGRLIWEKAPFFLLTVASSIATIWAQNKGGAIISFEYLPFLERLTNAIVSYMAYLGKTFWPVNLAVFYPYEHSFPLWEIIISGISLISITAAVLYSVKKLPFLFVGWLWYLGTLIPVMGLVQVGLQAMADRYTYLPSIGIGIMLAWGAPLLFQRLEIRKKILFSVAIAVLCLLALSTWMQCGYWENSIILYNHALQVTKDNFLVRINRGVAYATLGHNQRAMEDYNEAIRLKPDYGYPYYCRGNSYFALGQYQRAMEDYNKAIRLIPDYVQAYNYRGLAYLLQGNSELGCRDVQKACTMGVCKALEWAKGKGLCR